MTKSLEGMELRKQTKMEVKQHIERRVISGLW
jgi:hypothetical protein